MVNDSTSVKPSDSNTSPAATPPERKKGKWWRIPLKILAILIAILIAIPILLYIPPVQTLVKNIACSIVSKSTGMQMEIGTFRLRFPLDVELKDVTIIPAPGDTMVRAAQLIADVKLMPLLKSDVRINRLSLQQAALRILSADSSMDMRIRAALLEVAAGSSADIRTGHIDLRDAVLKNGTVQLHMDVWKKKPQPADTSATPFVITANSLKVENFRFAMAMLPTIDSLRLDSRDLLIEDANINLAENRISAANLKASDGSFIFLTPTAEYIKAHPAPADTVSAPDTPPMVIEGKRITLENFNLLYAVAGAKPVPGFDPSYISLSSLNVGLEGFRNAGTDITAPVTRLSGRERCGLNITQGSGTFSMDSTGMALRDFNVYTPFSHLDVSALIPNSLMELKPQAPLDVTADVSLGMPDINAFMPDVKKYTAPLGSAPLLVNLEARGKLGNADIPRLDIKLPGTLSLQASGRAQNILDPDRLKGNLKFNGDLQGPQTIEKITGPMDFALPRLKIEGTATANAGTYGADFQLTSPEGDIAGNGSVGLNSEKYHADIRITDLNVEAFMKDLGIGYVTASLQADGDGFNPEKPTARTDIHLDVDEIYYNNCRLDNINAYVGLADGSFSLDLHSGNQALDGTVTGTGSIAPDFYTFDIDADLRQLDLMALGMSETPNSGAAVLKLNGTASPSKWNYDVNADVTRVDWQLPDARYVIPAVDLKFKSTDLATSAQLTGSGTDLSFFSPRNLRTLLDSATAATTGLDKQIASRNVDIERLEDRLPPFRFSANASGKGLLADFLAPSGISLDTLQAVLTKDSLINGHLGVSKLNTGTMTLDRIALNLNQRGRLLDYKLQLDNGPGPMQEFADVSLSGYLGNNRASAFLNQRNIQGQQGYRVGMTVALMDSTVSLHFTPLKATIAYMPWSFNLDNHIDYTLTNHTLEANLEASSAESSILLKTEDSADGNGKDLHLNIRQLKIQDFLNMSVTAPPLTATVNSDIRLHYTGTMLEGKGSLNLSGLSYERMKLQDLDLGLTAGLVPSGDSKVEAVLKAGNRPALTAMALLGADSVSGFTPRSMELRFDGLPLDLANPFLGPQTASLSGRLKGECDMNISKDRGFRLNGDLFLDSAGVYLPIIGTTLRMPQKPIYLTDNVITFDDYGILACNQNPLVINGTVDATKPSDIKLNLGAAASNFQLVGTGAKARSDISGKLFLNLDARATGSLSVMNVNATAAILSATNVVYTMSDVAAELAANPAEGVVKFVNLQDTTAVAVADSLAQRPMAMRISASLTLQPGMQATVNLNSSGTNKAEVNPSGTLSYFQNYMGDMKLNGQLNTGSGLVRYSVPLLGTLAFNLQPQSNIVWTGDIMNPHLDIKADETKKANVSTGGQAQLVDFNVGLDVSGTLSSPKVLFDLSTENDMTIQNELQGMTPEQRSTTAMNMLITGQYTGTGAKTMNNNLVTGNLYNFMASTLNQWAANTIKGVDLSFGVNQYQTGSVDDSQTNTSYSYQVSKSLFSNRFKIVVGGNYSTDASADENFEQNLISDISFEYTLKQSNNYNIVARLFRHTGFESILEGEITETGVGLAYRRRLNNLRSFFRFRRNRNRSNPAIATVSQPDSAMQTLPPGTDTKLQTITPDTTTNQGNGKKND